MTTPSKLQRTAQGLRILYFAKEFTRRQAPRLGKRLELIEPFKYSSRTFPPQAMARDTWSLITGGSLCLVPCERKEKKWNGASARAT